MIIHHIVEVVAKVVARPYGFEYDFQGKEQGRTCWDCLRTVELCIEVLWGSCGRGAKACCYGACPLP